LLPTPKATDADRGGRGDLLQRGNQSPSGHFKTWPTPHGICQPGPRRPGPSGNELGRAVNEAEKMRPTPTASEHTGPGHSGGKNLRTVVAEFPTPTANRRDGLQSHGVNVVSGSLNPPWVAKLMGFPADWLDL
jgi:hypothetical protein